MPFAPGSVDLGYSATLPAWAVGISVGLVAASLVASPATSSSGAPQGSTPHGPQASAPARLRVQAARVSWVATWAASPMAASDTKQAAQGFGNQTVRDMIYTSVGGDALHVRLSNLFGTRPLTIGRASVGVVLDGARLVPGSDSPSTFGGRAAVTIPAGPP